MDNYIIKVLMDGDKEPSEILNFGNSPEEIIDNLIQIKGIKYLYHIKRVKDGEVWDFNEELEPLRKIRKIILQNGDGELILKLLLREEEENEKDPPEKLH